MTIIDKIRGNSQEKKPTMQQPTMPVPAKPVPSAATPLPPEVQAHIVAWTEMQEELARLRQTNTKLNNEIALQRDLVQQKEFALQDERQRFAENDRIKEKYLRFAQEILTRSEGLGTRLDEMQVQLTKMVQEMRNELHKMTARSMECAQNHEPEREDPVRQVEDQLKRAVAQATQPENIEGPGTP